MFNDASRLSPSRVRERSQNDLNVTAMTICERKLPFKMMEIARLLTHAGLRVTDLTQLISRDCMFGCRRESSLQVDTQIKSLKMFDLKKFI